MLLSSLLVAAHRPAVDCSVRKMAELEMIGAEELRPRGQSKGGNE